MKLRSLSFFTIDLENGELILESISLGDVKIEDVCFDLQKKDLVGLLETMLKKLKIDDV